MKAFRKGFLPISLLAVAFAATSALAQFEEGTHYERITGPDAGDRNGAIEVVEAFGYPCPACRSFLPVIHGWEENKPEDVEFRRLPVALMRGWDLYARAFYTAQVLEINAEAHEALFRAIHDQGRQFRSMSDLAEFYGQFGADAEEFRRTSQSFAVDSRMRQNASDVRRWGVRATPTMIVNGKWRVSPRRGGTYEELIEVVDYLVERERGAAEPETAPEA